MTLPALPDLQLTALQLPSAGPEPVPGEVARDAVLGYVHGRRPLWFRPPGERQGRWVQVPAFGWARFDDRPPAGTDDDGVLLAEGLHGRLDPAGWAEVRAALERARPHADAAVARAAGRAFWELPDDELSVLGEPGTVGAALRAIGEGPQPAYVSAALHHRSPTLVPHVDRTTWLQLVPHAREGDSGVHAVVHRELRANDAGFTALERALAGDGVALTRLRLHDVLVWLAGSLRTDTAVGMGRTRRAR